MTMSPEYIKTNFDKKTGVFTGDIWFYDDLPSKKLARSLVKVKGDIHIREGKAWKFPKLKEMDYIILSYDLKHNDSNLEFPVLEKVEGYKVKSKEERKQLLIKVAQCALARPDALDMDNWHRDEDGDTTDYVGNLPVPKMNKDGTSAEGYCNTTHCIGGWAVYLSGVRGRMLEAKLDTEAAAAILLGPEAVSWFYKDNDWAEEFLESVLKKARKKPFSYAKA